MADDRDYPLRLGVTGAPAMFVSPMIAQRYSFTRSPI